MPRLDTGQRFKRELAPGQVHRYSVALSIGDYIRVVVDQHGIDVVTSLYSPDERKCIEMDTPLGSRGAEELSWIAERPGTYHLEVRSLEQDTVAGAYEIVLEGPRVPTGQDRLGVLADAAFAEGYRLEEAESADDHRCAIEKLETAIGLLQRIGDSRRQAVALSTLGLTWRSLADHARARACYAQAAFLWRSIGYLPGEANAQFALGLAEYLLHDVDQALKHYADALVIQRSLGDRREEAEVLTNIGMAYDTLGDYELALEQYRSALPLMRSVRNRSGELRTLNNIGHVYDFRGDSQKALDSYREALGLARSFASRKMVAFVLTNVGYVYSGLGESENALSHFEEALTVFHGLGDLRNEATVLICLGQVYARQRDFSKATSAYDRSLSLLSQIRDRKREGSALNGLGEVRLVVGDPTQARVLFERALELARETGNLNLQGLVLTNLGAASSALAEKEASVDYLSRALSLLRAIGDRPGEGAALFELARVERERGRLEEARSNVESALATVETLRSELSSHELRSSLLGNAQRYYAFEIELLIEMHRREPAKGFDARAFAISERGRARSLLDLLEEARLDLHGGADPELINRKRSLQRAISSWVVRSDRALQGGDREPTSSPGSELEALRARYQDVEQQIRAASPRYANLTQQEPITVSEVQALVDDATLLLEYALGDERSYLWAITRGTLTTYELPKRTEIEMVARRFHELLTARDLSPDFETPQKRRARVTLADRESIEVAHQLSRMLLEPVASRLGTKRLLIVADGALLYVPFSALSDPSKRRVPLIARHELVSSPSASALALLRKELAGRKPAPKRLAVLADPVFDKDDLRVGGPAGKRFRSADAPVAARDLQERHRGLLRAARDVGFGRNAQTPIPRLPFTRTEAGAILAHVAPPARKVALDFDANLDTATSAELSQFQYLHFATHGFLNSIHPELSGLVLSLVDRDGRDREGFLSAAEIFNLRLPADLVVLSGCRTGLGKEIHGEGLIGLTRAFMHAGAARVLVSLWDVDDRATAELMSHLYREMLGPGRLAPAAALRSAQTSVMRDARWNAPFYWAAFVLQGGPN